MVKKIFSNVSNKGKAIYLIWVLINLFILLRNINIPTSYPPVKYFFPFVYNAPNDIPLDYYDITEFIFYAILPILLYITINLLKSKDNMVSRILSYVPNIVIAIYIYWIMINFFVLMRNTSIPMSYHPTRYFFPFVHNSSTDIALNYYDITEFIFYSILPIIIYLIIKLFTAKDKPKE